MADEGVGLRNYQAKKVIRSPQPLSEPTIWSYTRHLVLGLEYLHMCGIVHRDIKPENVVFEMETPGDTHVKLIDFGTAVALEERGEKISTGGRIGTWSYWAAEQVRMHARPACRPRLSMHPCASVR